MTDAIEFGPEIKRGSPLWPEGQKRPVWLADDVAGKVAAVLTARWGGEVQWPHINEPGEEEIPDMDEWEWSHIAAIRLSESHPASIAQRWNDDNPGEKPWTVLHFGSEEAPADWDGGDVLLRDGTVLSANGIGYWNILDGNYHIIAYRSKPSEQTVEDDGYVRVPVMTEAEALAWYREAVRMEAARVDPMVRHVFDLLGVLKKDETPVERFKRENPGLSGDELLEKALAR